MTEWSPGTANPPLTLLRAVATGDPEADLLAGVDLLREVRSGGRPATLRIYRPDPTMAFGQRDVRLPGFAEASSAASAAGFAPVVRKAGGRAAAYHRGTLIVDHIEPAREAMVGHQHRFKSLGRLYADALRTLGVDAGVGELPGEYCPGDYSVHGVHGAGSTAASPVKLVGTAQRVVAGAWLFASVFVVEDSAPLRAVLADVYGAMGLPLDPATVGSVEDLIPGTGVADVEAALLDAYAGRTDVLGR